MEIHALKLVVTEADLNELAKSYLPKDSPVRNLRSRVEDGLVRVSGDYPALFVPIPFETQWEVSVQGMTAVIRLVGLKVVGVPAGMLRGVILAAIGKHAAKEPHVRLEDGTLILDLDGLLRQHGVVLRAGLREVRCRPGQVVLDT
jgi:hypothetical protein